MSGLIDDTIHKACQRCDLEAVRRFLEVEDVGVDCRDVNGDTPLIIAVLEGLLSWNEAATSAVISYLISKNANVEAITTGRAHCRNTALMIASYHGKLQVVDMLLQQGKANVNYSIPVTGKTALYWATMHDEGLSVVPTLLQHGANTNPVLAHAWDSPLLNACSIDENSADIVQQLLECGANLHAKNGDGTTAIHYAAERSEQEATLQLLIAHGANVNVHSEHTDHRRTPLSRAAHFGQVATLRVLLEHGAKVDFIFENGYSILHQAEPDNFNIFRVLLDHCRSTMTGAEFGSLLLQADRDGCIALQYINSVKVAKLFIEQPRGRDQQLLPACHKQLVCTPLSSSCSDNISEYLETFQSRVLSTPSGATSPPKRQKTATTNHNIAVKLNPSLNDFQRSVAEEALELVLDATDCPDYMAHAILGYLSPLDLMKRSVAAN